MRRVVSAVIAMLCVSAVLVIAGPAEAAKTYNPPTIDRSSLLNGGRACATVRANPMPLSFFASDLEAVAVDPHEPMFDQFLFHYRLWPLASPASVSTADVSQEGNTPLGRWLLPNGSLVSGQRYGWQVSVSDGNGTSQWSPACYFAYDTTRPSAPTVTSTNYPQNGSAPIGQLAVFTFSGNGDPDVAGFEYDWGGLPVPGCAYSGQYGQLECPDPLSAPDVVRADQPGGTADVTLNPVFAGPQTLVVATLDRAGNRSDQVSYSVFIPFNAPDVQQATSAPECGNHVRMVFTPHAGVTGVVSYRVTVDSQPTYTVTAAANGTARTDIHVPTQFSLAQVVSVSANGFVSEPNNTTFFMNLTPTVSSDIYPPGHVPAGGVGVTGTFSFAPPANGVWTTDYRYQFGTAPSQTVAADPNFDGASVPFTPAVAGPQQLSVTAVDGTGNATSCTATYSFDVAG